MAYHIRRNAHKQLVRLHEQVLTTRNRLGVAQALLLALDLGHEARAYAERLRMQGIPLPEVFLYLSDFEAFYRQVGWIGPAVDYPRLRAALVERMHAAGVYPPRLNSKRMQRIRRANAERLEKARELRAEKLNSSTSTKSLTTPQTAC